MSALEFRLVPDEDLRVGDTVRVLGVARRILAIRPYEGKYVAEGCVGVADTEPGVGFSLWRGTETECLREVAS